MSNKTYKTSLADVVAGDPVVLKSDGSYRMMNVTRVTNTQVIIGEQRFRKDDGKEIGGYGLHKDTIYAPSQLVADYASNYVGETWVDRFHEYMEKRTLEIAKRPYIDFIDEISRRALTRLQLETLKQAAELLGYKDE